MIKQPIYQVDAFTSTLYMGNPAAVCPLEYWLDDTVMQLIARENNLSETAFIVPDGKHYQIRWFTPNTEVDLCGHATLASAFVLFELLGYQEKEIAFKSKSGILTVRKEGNLLQMDFPALPFTKIEDPGFELITAIKMVPDEIYQSKFDILCIFNDAITVKQAKPDLNTLANMPCRGIIFSAPAIESDVYSRCFYPGCDVPEDPVTGSAHCVIAPYWCARLNKKKIHACQGGNRQGELWCEVNQDRVILSGYCQLYLQGEIWVPSV
ncbi:MULTISPECIES: PhzF family phenazine biosynthesis protein [unclassified Legionella]|uniref:PhzF family phenazine biosynthesis protein n=1 Tax=unclassified Legionella TaxID=2622702 RepID=UPI00105650DC|nr:MULTISPECIES: PhzF family phenazine biosynthesis protein [unclassified Legionella]MDI9818543.1 PhzF family phenazine biosynthesis protein [Legionella sp. PL877]